MATGWQQAHSVSCGITDFLPRLPGAFVVVALSIPAVAGLDLAQRGVATLGDVPGGLPSFVLPSFEPAIFEDLFGAAAGLVLVSFTSGVLTAKGFARRNGYGINANLADLRLLYRLSHRELLMPVGATLGVLMLGVLPGVRPAVALSLLWLLSVGSRPKDAVLGRVRGMKGFQNVADYPEAKTIPGLLL